MKSGLVFFPILLALILYGHSSPKGSQPTMIKQSEELQRANVLWEKAISAKGGREKLQSVQSLVVSSNSKFLQAPKDIPGHHIEALYVVPDKLWEWIDSRPGAFGLNIFVSDFGRGVAWELSDKWSSARPLRTKPDLNLGSSSYDPNADSKYRSNKERFLEDQFIYLMETKFLKPTLVRSRGAKIGARKVDMIEGFLERERIEVYLDSNSHLPVRIVFITKLESGRDYVEVVGLGDYVEVRGIQMPQRVSRGSDENNKTAYQINVDYNPAIFEHPPTIDMGPAAWKTVKD